jgi:hypothetical protein
MFRPLGVLPIDAIQQHGQFGSAQGDAGLAFGRCRERLLQEVLNDLGSLKLRSRYDNDGYWFDDAGFVLHAPDNVVNAVTVYRKGYYEEEVDLASKVVT